MSRKKTGKNRSVRSLGDVTLNDFANSALSKNRLKKPTNNLNIVLKNFEEEKSWDEKIDDFEGEFEQQVDEDGNVFYIIKKYNSRKRKNVTLRCKKEDYNLGNNYPIDIWFLISEYIRPEDVGRFAGICKSCYEVICTAKFWFNLYRRYYNNSCHLPNSLEPKCLVRRFSLRTSVIRALHYMYPPFNNRINRVIPEESVNLLKGKICDSMWHQIYKNHCIFYFKMKERIHFLVHSKTDYKQTDLLEILDDVSANPDQFCKILKVTCKYFVQVPPYVIGQVLTSVSQTSSKENHMISPYDRLQLVFSSSTGGYSSAGGSTCCTVILDPVSKFTVLDWWHPLYPHSHKIQDLLNQE